MKVKQLIELIDNRFHVTIKVFDPTAVETELINRFGEPLIQVGGEITGSATREGESATSVTFSLPSEQRRILSDFPLLKVFDLGDDEDADVTAKVYSETILSRITSTLTSLRANAVNFVGETTTTISNV